MKNLLLIIIAITAIGCSDKNIVAPGNVSNNSISGEWEFNDLGTWERFSLQVDTLYIYDDKLNVQVEYGSDTVFIYNDIYDVIKVYEIQQNEAKVFFNIIGEKKLFKVDISL